MRKVAIIFFLLAVSSQVNAQHRAVQGMWHVGLKEGVTTSQISGDLHQGFKKFGMTGGVYLNKRSRNGVMAVQIEALYVEKGSRWYQPPYQDTATAAAGPYYTPPTRAYLLRLHYLEFPLMIQYDLEDKLHVKGLMAEIGPSVGFVVHKEEYKAIPGYNVYQYGPSFKGYEVSYNIGIHYTLPENFGFIFRFSRSVTPVRGYIYSGSPKTFLKPGQQNTVMSLSLTYRIDLK